MKSARRSAFTLVEMLVVISIIGVMMALLLPAVQAAREVARRMKCVSNQRNVGIACLQFEGLTTDGRLPGYHNRLKLQPTGQVMVSWPVVLFPHLEQANAQDNWKNGNFVAPSLAIFICPSDTNHKPGDAATLSYVINAGMATNNPNLEIPQDGVAHNYFSTVAGYGAPGNGVAVRTAEFRDGKTYTLLFSENLQASRWDVLDNPAGSGGNYKQSTVFVWQPTTNPSADQKINGNKLAMLDANTRRPSSNHIGGVNAVFADGHTQFLSQTIDYRVYVFLMTPSGGNSPNVQTVFGPFPGGTEPLSAANVVN